MTVKVYYIEGPLVEYMWWKTPSLHLKKSHDTEHFITTHSVLKNKYLGVVY